MEVINGEKKYVIPFSSPNVSITDVSLVDASVVNFKKIYSRVSIRRHDRLELKG